MSSFIVLSKQFRYLAFASMLFRGIRPMMLTTIPAKTVNTSSYTLTVPLVENLWTHGHSHLRIWCFLCPSIVFYKRKAVINVESIMAQQQMTCRPIVYQKGSVKCNAENFYQKIIISISNLINYFKERVSIQKIIYPLHIRRNFLRIFQVIVLFEKNATKGFCPVCFYACNKQSAELRT